MTSVCCPETYCYCASGAYKQPNMRLFSLNEQDEWTLWRSNSDYFYPEMIPEPDYSDSGDDAGSEDEEYVSLSRNSRSVAERLRDVTEVYVSNADVKIKKTPSPKVSSHKLATSSRKQTSKTFSGEKIERQPGKMSPKTLPKAPRKARSKSPARVSKPASPTLKSSKPQESVKKTPVKTKSPPSKLSASNSIKRTKSPETSKKTVVRPKSPAKATDSKLKATAGRTKSPESVRKIPTKTKSYMQTVTPEKPKPETELQSSKIKATSKAKSDSKTSDTVTKKEAGDAQKFSPISSPTTDEAKSGMSSAVSTEPSSDDELIKPKKPYQFSSEKQKLHKELKFSQRYGKLVSPKTELQLAIERFTENKEKKELEIGEKTSLEKILEIQARKLKLQEDTDKSSWMDHLQKPPTSLPDPRTDEFYRVHARVVSNNILTHCFLPDDDQSEYLSSQTLSHIESGSDS